MAKNKDAKVVSLEDRIRERIQTLKKQVSEKRGAAENPKADRELRELRKGLKRLQRKLARMQALEKRAQDRAKKPETKTEDKETKEAAAPEASEGAGGDSAEAAG